MSAKYLRHLTHRVVTRRCAMLAELSPKRHPWGLGSPNRLFGATHRSTNEISSNRMAAFVLPFEKPVVDLVDRVRHLRELAQNDAKFEPELLRLEEKAGRLAREIFADLVADAEGDDLASPQPPLHARLRAAAFHRLGRAARRSPVRRRPVDRVRPGALPWAQRGGRRATRRGAAPKRT